MLSRCCVPNASLPFLPLEGKAPRVLGDLCCESLWQVVFPQYGQKQLEEGALFVLLLLLRCPGQIQMLQSLCAALSSDTAAR